MTAAQRGSAAEPHLTQIHHKNRHATASVSRNCWICFSPIKLPLGCVVELVPGFVSSLRCGPHRAAEA
jgi:hypothetical protein